MSWLVGCWWSTFVFLPFTEPRVLPRPRFLLWVNILLTAWNVVIKRRHWCLKFQKNYLFVFGISAASYIVLDVLMGMSAYWKNIIRRLVQSSIDIASEGMPVMSWVMTMSLSLKWWSRHQTELSVWASKRPINTEGIVCLLLTNCAKCFCILKDQQQFSKMALKYSVRG